jgi:hypothetical protein
MRGKVDTSVFAALCRNLATISGKEFEPVVMLQIGQLMKACIAITPVRPEGQVTKYASRSANHIEFADGTIISNWSRGFPLAGEGVEMFLDLSNFDPSKFTGPKSAAKRKAPTLRGGMSWHMMNADDRHWSAERWARWQTRIAERPAEKRRRVQAALASRGLAKKSWWQIADALGIDPGIAPAYVRNAKSPDGKEYQDGFANKMVMGAAYVVQLINQNHLIAGKLNGEWILERAMVSRAKAYNRDLALGVFADVKRRAQRYPGIFVT